MATEKVYIQTHASPETHYDEWAAAVKKMSFTSQVLRAKGSAARPDFALAFYKTHYNDSSTWQLITAAIARIPEYSL